MTKVLKGGTPGTKNVQILVRIPRSRLGKLNRRWSTDRKHRPAKIRRSKAKVRPRSPKIIQKTFVDCSRSGNDRPNLPILVLKLDPNRSSPESSPSCNESCNDNVEDDRNRRTHFKKKIIEKHSKAVHERLPSTSAKPNENYGHNRRVKAYERSESESGNESIEDDKHDQKENSTPPVHTSSSSHPLDTTKLNMSSKNKAKLVVLENKMINSPMTSSPQKSITKNASLQSSKSAVGKHVLPTVMTPQQQNSRVAMPLNNHPTSNSPPKSKDKLETKDTNYPNVVVQAEAEKDTKFREIEKISQKLLGSAVRRKRLPPVKRRSTLVDENHQEMLETPKELNQPPSTISNGLELLSMACTVTTSSSASDKDSQLRMNPESSEEELPKSDVPKEASPGLPNNENSNVQKPPTITKDNVGAGTTQAHPVPNNSSHLFKSSQISYNPTYLIGIEKPEIPTNVTTQQEAQNQDHVQNQINKTIQSGSDPIIPPFVPPYPLPPHYNQPHNIIPTPTRKSSYQENRFTSEAPINNNPIPYRHLNGINPTLPQIPFSRDISLYPFLIQQIQHQHVNNNRRLGKQRSVSNPRPPPPYPMEAIYRHQQPAVYPMLSLNVNKNVLPFIPNVNNLKVVDPNETCTLYYESQNAKGQPECTKTVLYTDAPVAARNNPNVAVGNPKQFPLPDFLKLADTLTPAKNDEIPVGGKLVQNPSKVPPTQSPKKIVENISEVSRKKDDNPIPVGNNAKNNISAQIPPICTTRSVIIQNPSVMATAKEKARSFSHRIENFLNSPSSNDANKNQRAVSQNCDATITHITSPLNGIGDTQTEGTRNNEVKNHSISRDFDRNKPTIAAVENSGNTFRHLTRVIVEPKFNGARSYASPSRERSPIQTCQKEGIDAVLNNSTVLKMNKDASSDFPTVNNNLIQVCSNGSDVNLMNTKPNGARFDAPPSSQASTIKTYEEAEISAASNGNTVLKTISSIGSVNDSSERRFPTEPSGLGRNWANTKINDGKLCELPSSKTSTIKVSEKEGIVDNESVLKMTKDTSNGILKDVEISLEQGRLTEDPCNGAGQNSTNTKPNGVRFCVSSFGKTPATSVCEEEERNGGRPRTPHRTTIKDYAPEGIGTTCNKATVLRMTKDTSNDRSEPRTLTEHFLDGSNGNSTDARCNGSRLYASPFDQTSVAKVYERQDANCDRPHTSLSPGTKIKATQEINAGCGKSSVLKTNQDSSNEIPRDVRTCIDTNTEPRLQTNDSPIVSNPKLNGTRLQELLLQKTTIEPNKRERINTACNQNTVLKMTRDTSNSIPRCVDLEHRSSIEVFSSCLNENSTNIKPNGVRLHTSPRHTISTNKAYEGDGTDAARNDSTVSKVIKNTSNDFPRYPRLLTEVLSNSTEGNLTDTRRNGLRPYPSPPGDEVTTEACKTNGVDKACNENSVLKMSKSASNDISRNTNNSSESKSLIRIFLSGANQNPKNTEATPEIGKITPPSKDDNNHVVRNESDVSSENSPNEATDAALNSNSFSLTQSTISTNCSLKDKLSDENETDVKTKREFLQCEAKDLNHKSLYDMQICPSDTIEIIFAKIMPTCFVMLNLIHEMQTTDNSDWWPVDTVGNLKKIKLSLRGITVFLNKAEKIVSGLDPFIYHFFLFMLGCFEVFKERIQKILDSGYTRKENFISSDEADIYRDVFIQLYDYLCCTRFPDYVNYITNKQASSVHGNEASLGDNDDVRFATMRQKQLLITEKIKQRCIAEKESNENFKSFISQLENCDRIFRNDGQVGDAKGTKDTKTNVIVIDSDSEEDISVCNKRQNNDDARRSKRKKLVPITSHNITHVIELDDDDDGDVKSVDADDCKKRRNNDESSETNKRLCQDQSVLTQRNQNENLIPSVEVTNEHIEVHEEVAPHLLDNESSKDSIKSLSQTELDMNPEQSDQSDRELFKAGIKEEMKDVKSELEILSTEISKIQNEIPNVPSMEQNLKEVNYVDQFQTDIENSSRSSPSLTNSDSVETIEAIQIYLRETDSKIQTPPTMDPKKSEEILDRNDSNISKISSSTKSVFTSTINNNCDNKLIGIATPNVKDADVNSKKQAIITNGSENNKNTSGHDLEKKQNDNLEAKRRIITEKYCNLLLRDKNGKETDGDKAATQKLISFRKPLKKVQTNSIDHVPDDAHTQLLETPQVQATHTKVDSNYQNNIIPDTSEYNKAAIVAQNVNSSTEDDQSNSIVSTEKSPVNEEDIPPVSTAASSIVPSSISATVSSPENHLVPVTPAVKKICDNKPVKEVPVPIPLSDRRIPSRVCGSNMVQHKNSSENMGQSMYYNKQVKVAISEYFDAQRIVARQVAAMTYTSPSAKGSSTSHTSSIPVTTTRTADTFKSRYTHQFKVPHPPPNSKELLRQAVTKRHLSQTQPNPPISTPLTEHQKGRSRPPPTPIPSLQSIYNDSINTNGFISQLIKDEIGVLSKKESLGPVEYVDEISTLHRLPLIPKDFKDFYIFVTKQQILQFHQPIAFYIFLELLNQSGLKDYHKKFTEYTKRKFEDRVNSKKRDESRYHQLHKRNHT